MTFREFSELNLRRTESPSGFNHKLSDWSLSDWMTATLSTLGRAAEAARKLKYIEAGAAHEPGDVDALNSAIQEEVASTFIYLDLLAQSQGFSLEDAARAKFQRTSEKIGYVDAGQVEVRDDG